MNYDEAVLYCQQWSGTLVEFKSMAENQKAYRYLSKSNLLIVCGIFYTYPMYVATARRMYKRMLFVNLSVHRVPISLSASLSICPLWLMHALMYELVGME